MEKKRIYFIDIARAISIILIVVSHYQLDNFPDYWFRFIDAITSFRLPLLLFVSGYIYWETRKPITYRDFVWKKFQRLMIPYFFVSILVITIKLVVEKELYLENPVSLSAYFQIFYFPGVSGAFLWFIYTLFLMFLIMPFFNNRRKLLYLLGISLVLYFIPIPFPSFFALADLKRIMVYFVLGCVLCEYSEIREKSHINVFVVLGFYIIVYILGKQLDFAVFTPVLKFALALCGIYVVANFAQALEQRTIKIRKILLNIAACTYTIYLFHTTFMGFAKAVILKLGFQLVDPNNFFVFISMALIVILAGVVAPIILHKKVVRYSRFFSYLIGAKFIGTKEKRIKEGCLES